MVGDARWGDQPDHLSDLPHARRVAAPPDRGVDVLEDVPLAGVEILPGRPADTAEHNALLARYGATPVLDPAADSWVTKSPMPTPRSGLNTANLNGIIYAAGNGLRASTLADVMARAGAVRAMTLDIDPEYPTVARATSKSALRMAQ